MNSLRDFKLTLCDLSGHMVDTWRKVFQPHLATGRVEVRHGDILQHTADAIISPANSFGYMTGGIDGAYTRRWVVGLQERLQDAIVEKHGGELMIGNAEIVPTRDPLIPYLIAAPTMRVPHYVGDTVNAYLALRAALRAAVAHNVRCGTIGDNLIELILCPGLCTASGRMEPYRAAVQMEAAYRQVCILPSTLLAGRHLDPVGTCNMTLVQHAELLRLGDGSPTPSQH